MSSLVDWEWANRLPSLAICEAAGLSLGFELNTLAPDHQKFTGRPYIEPPKEYGERIFLAYMAVKAGDILRSREAEKSQTFDSKADYNEGQLWEIDPADFRRWCDSENFVVPAEWLPRGYAPAQTTAPPTPAVEAPATDALKQADTQPQAAPVMEAPASETPEQRRARWLATLEVEEKRGKHGALQRVADREGVDRSNMSKGIKKARAIRTEQSRAGFFVSHLVQDGKRKG